MASEVSIERDVEREIKSLWKTVEENRDSAVAAAGHAVAAAIKCGQILALRREEMGGPSWEHWLSDRLPEIPIPKATRLANIGPKYRDGFPDQLEFKTVKELYQAADILPPPAPTNAKSASISTDWPKLVGKLESMVPHLNDGQKELLRKALVKIAEGL